jgi:hypothetical protein
VSQFSYTKKPNFLADAKRPFKLTEASCILSNSATTCTRAAGSFITDGVVAGQTITGAGIVAGTTVSSVNSATSITLSQNTTSSAAGTVELLFAPASLPITYAAPEGWIQPGVGGNNGVAIQSASWTGSVLTYNATAHGLVTGQDALITGVIGGTIAEGYNGHKAAVTVVTADQFTVAQTANPGTATVVATLSKVWSIYEVLVAMGGLDTTYADFLTIPTFTAAVTLAGTGVGGTFHYVTGNVFTVILTASEPIAVNVGAGLPTLQLNITSGAKQAVYNPALSGASTMAFSYTLVAGDIATATNVTTGTTIAANGGVFNDIAGNHVAGFTPGSFTAAAITTVAFN